MKFAGLVQRVDNLISAWASKLSFTLAMQFLYKNKNSKPIDFQLIKITFNIIFTNKTQEMLKIEK
jgi:hypothetical protein